MSILSLLYILYRFVPCVRRVHTYSSRLSLSATLASAVRCAHRTTFRHCHTWSTGFHSTWVLFVPTAATLPQCAHRSVCPATLLSLVSYLVPWLRVQLTQGNPAPVAPTLSRL